jgi:hypothetical protein
LSKNKTNPFIQNIFKTTRGAIECIVYYWTKKKKNCTPQYRTHQINKKSKLTRDERLKNTLKRKKLNLAKRI